MQDIDHIEEGSGFSVRMLAPFVVASSIALVVAMFGRKEPSKAEMVKAQGNQALADPRVRRAIETAQHAFDEALHRIDVNNGQELKKRVQSAVETGRAEIPPRTRDVSERALEIADRLRAEGAVRSSEIGERLKTDVAPVAKEWAQEALVEAEEILATARERAGEFSDTAREEYAPKLSSGASNAGKVVAGTAAGVAHTVGKKLGESNKRSKRSMKRKSASTLQRGKARAGDALHTAGSQTKYAFSETFMIFFWASALGATIYYGLLSQEQRDRVKSFFTGTFDQVQDLLQDFDSPQDELPNSSV